MSRPVRDERGHANVEVGERLQPQTSVGIELCETVAMDLVVPRHYLKITIYSVEKDVC